MRIIHCDESFTDPILDIFNEAIANSTALYDYKPRTSESMRMWFAAKRQGGFPVIGALSEQNVLLGFASYGTFRAFPAYKYTVEHSVYVAAQHRGQGGGRRLLQEIILLAEKQDYHVLVGAIDAANIVSVALHKSLGFQHAGRLKQVGFKFGRWLDLDFWQLNLATPEQPVDG